MSTREELKGILHALGGKRKPNADPHELAAAILKKHRTEHWRFWRGDFYRYKGTHYEAIPNTDLRPMINADLRAHFERKSPRAHVTNQLVGNVISALQSKCLLQHTIEPDSWLDERTVSAGTTFVSVENGIVEIPADPKRPVVLHKHSPQWFSLTTRTYRYELAAECPKWLRFLDRIMEGDAERIAIHQEWSGLVLTPHGFRQFFFVAEGEGANGKGTLCNVLTDLVGRENVSALHIDGLSSQFGPASLVGKQLNISSESEKITAAAEAQLKAYTGDDTVFVDRKNRDAISMRPTVRLMLVTNNRPRFHDTTTALWRRMILLPYRVVIPPSERVDGFADQLKAELPGIFNWAIQGLRRLRQQGVFTKSAVCEAALTDYKAESNPARQFLLEHSVAGDPDTVATPCQRLYDCYRVWCQEHGYRSLNASNFGRQVQKAFPNAVRGRATSGKRVWQYRGLWTEATDSEFQDDQPVTTRLSSPIA
jgi:putative DNA primase/helicase